jgi:hypothetical protein
MQATHYRGKVDGDIKKYLRRRHEDGAVCPSFVGYEPFEQLWALGVVTPGVTSIRLNFSCRQDEHYDVIDRDTAEGVSLNAHSGHQGRHSIKALLTNKESRYWEVDGLHPSAYRD